jgi:hypothetical protein
MTPGSSGVGEFCAVVLANDEDCAAGLTGLFNGATDYCDRGNCCVELCDVTDPDPACSNGAVCKQFWPAAMFVGLEHLGFCGRP